MFFIYHFLSLDVSNLDSGFNISVTNIAII